VRCSGTRAFRSPWISTAI
jgi:hypothetical protein